MRLLFVCPDMRVGGSQRQWLTLIRSLHERGEDVSLLALSGEGPFLAELRAAGVRTACAGMASRVDRTGLRRAGAFAGKNVDVVVSRDVSAQIVGHGLARRAGAAHAFNEHTPCTPEGGLLPMRPHQRALVRVVAPHVDRVIAVTEAQRPPIEALGYRPERVRVVPNGLFDEGVRATRTRHEVRAELGLRDEDFAALHVAVLRPEKGGGTFVEAVARAGPPVVGLLAGSGRDEPRVQALAEAAGGAARLLGERSDVPELMLAADAVCLASEAEALPMSILEAMAIGRPVLATRVGGVDEAVEEGVTGRVLPPRDAEAFGAALRELAGDRDRARHMGEEGRERRRRLFSGERMVDGYLEAFREVAGR